MLGAEHLPVLAVADADVADALAIRHFDRIGCSHYQSHQVVVSALAPHCPFSPGAFSAFLRRPFLSRFSSHPQPTTAGGYAVCVLLFLFVGRNRHHQIQVVVHHFAVAVAVPDVVVGGGSPHFYMMVGRFVIARRIQRVAGAEIVNPAAPSPFLSVLRMDRQHLAAIQLPGPQSRRSQWRLFQIPPLHRLPQFLLSAPLFFVSAYPDLVLQYSHWH